MREYKIVVLGSEGVGRTAITIQFTQNVFLDNYTPSGPGIYYRKHLRVDEEECFLEILDTAGCWTQQYPAMRDQYLKNGQGFIPVYSIVAQSTFNDLPEFFQQIYRAKDGNVPILLVGNKADLEDERVVSNEYGMAMADKFGCRFMETSAKTRQNIDQVFIEIVREINRQSPVPKAQKTTCCCSAS